MAEAAQLWLAIEYTGYIPEPASLPAASRDCGMDGRTGSLGITQPRTHRIGYLGVEQDLRERREHVGSREQLGEVEVEPSSEWVQTKVLSNTIETNFQILSTKYAKFQPNIQIFEYSISCLVTYINNYFDTNKLK